MKIRTLFLTGCLAAFSLFPALTAAPTGAPAPLDPALFTSRFFPGIDKLSQAELWLDGLAKHYPNRVLTSPRELTISAARQPFVTTLDLGVAYIRVYNLESALPAIRSHRSKAGLLLDLRSVHANLKSSLQLGRLLADGKPVNLTLVGQFGKRRTGTVAIKPDGQRPEALAVVVLTNHDTAGPLEAILAGLQHEKAVIGVGLPTDGLTGSFEPVPGDHGYYVIVGEIHPAGGRSLIGSGFRPDIRVDTSARADARAYAAMTDAASLKELINPPVTKQRFDEDSLIQDFRQENGSESDGETASTANPPAARKPAKAEDLILEKGQSIMEALLALHKIHTP